MDGAGAGGSSARRRRVAAERRRAAVAFTCSTRFQSVPSPVPWPSPSPVHLFLHLLPWRILASFREGGVLQSAVNCLISAQTSSPPSWHLGPALRQWRRQGRASAPSWARHSPGSGSPGSTPAGAGGLFREASAGHFEADVGLSSEFS